MLPSPASSHPHPEFDPPQPTDPTTTATQHDHDSDHSDSDSGSDLGVEFPSSGANLRPAAKPKGPKVKRRRGKRTDKAKAPTSHLLSLPSDVLHLLLSRLPPRSLLQMSATCTQLNAELKNETFWRQSYINTFLWDGAASDARARDQVKALVQGCMGVGGRGWKREALSREGMLDRWISSRASTVVHIPVNVVVASLSLLYPPQLPSLKSLVVGKMTGTKSPTSDTGSPAAMTPTKMSHRQKYETQMAVSSRPAPTLYSAGLDNSALVKSDPLTGKVSKGFWGPGQDANFHLRPHWDPSSAPQAVHIPKRSQTHMLWGQLTGYVVHTTMATRSHATHGGRANSINVYPRASDIHTGPVTALHQPEGEVYKWASGGADGVVKYWQLNPGSGKSGKKTPTELPATISCLFTSATEEPFKQRPEEVRLRQLASPDAIVAVACDPAHDVVAGVTEDGDLRVWFEAAGDAPRQVRIDAGSKEEFGGVKRLFMHCSDTAASVLVHHDKHPVLTRYDVSLSGDEHTIKTSFYRTPSDVPLTALFVSLDPSPPIAAPPEVEKTMSARIVTPASGGASSGTSTPNPDPVLLEDLPRRLTETPYGRFIAYIWSWDRNQGDEALPIRSWVAAEGTITALDFYCGLVAVGAYDGHYAVFDPLPVHVERLRAFRPPVHYTPGDLALAASDEPRAKYYTVNDLIVDNDLVVAAIGRNVQTWRAATPQKPRKEDKSSSTSRKGSGRSNAHRVDLQYLHHDAAESHYEIQAENEVERVSVSHEQAHRAAMEGLGLADGDAALQYALMLSQQESESSPVLAPTGSESDDELEAIRAVEEFERAEAARIAREAQTRQEDEDDLAEILEMIRLAEERERK